MLALLKNTRHVEFFASYSRQIDLLLLGTDPVYKYGVLKRVEKNNR